MLAGATTRLLQNTNLIYFLRFVPLSLSFIFLGVLYLGASLPRNLHPSPRLPLCFLPHILSWTRFISLFPNILLFTSLLLCLGLSFFSPTFHLFLLYSTFFSISLFVFLSLPPSPVLSFFLFLFSIPFLLSPSLSHFCVFSPSWSISSSIMPFYYSCSHLVFVSITPFPLSFSLPLTLSL